MKKNYILLLMLSLLLIGISCDTDKLEEELDGADNIVVPDYNGILAFPIGTINYTVDELLEDAGDDLGDTVNSEGIVVFSFSEPDTIDIDAELGEQPDLDFDVELRQTLEVPAISFAIDFFEQFDGGKFEIENPELAFNFVNTLQIPSSLQFIEFAARKYDENGSAEDSVFLTWNDPSDALQSINTPTRLNPEAAITDDLVINSTNSNLREMLAIGPDSLTMQIGFVAFPDVVDTVIYFDIDTLGPYIANVDTVIVSTVDANGDSIPDLDSDGDPILVIDTTFFDLGPQTWSKDPSGAPRTDMTLIPDSTEIIPIYVASGEQILEATTGSEQDGVPGILTFDDLEVVFNTSTGRVVEGKEGYITTNLTYTHPESTYDLLDTLFVGTDLTGIDPKAIQDPTTGDVAWAVVVTRYIALYGLNSGATIATDVVMELPVVINLTDLTVTQEIDFDSRDDITDLLDELGDNNQNTPTVELILSTVNELPLGVSIDIKFLDTDSVQIYSQPTVQLIEAPSLTDGAIAAITSSSAIELDGDALEALKTTETIQLVLTLNTPAGVFLPLIETSAVNITLSLKVTN
ncbi:MAG: hypothetical protein P8N26_11085 [Cyclobacteriaceae bacterium]|nr:hypothetical protein [Flammeovirgaceae bacterium]MDG1106693.1 hypothetical protein [Cyclobacteriaceae bacterium]